MLIALFPQAYFAVRRGHEWNRANAISHPDEVAYSAYLASLIRGNPRRYDPFTGRGADANSSTESLFSVQLVPAYAVALPARALHLRPATVFIMLPAICALASSLALFWGVTPVLTAERDVEKLEVLVLERGLVKPGSVVVFISVQPDLTRADTNFLNVQQIG